MIRYDVVFRYRDDARDEDDPDQEWSRVTFDTMAEARAFEDGITYGDEPLYESDGIEECRFAGEGEHDA